VAWYSREPVFYRRTLCPVFSKPAAASNRLLIDTSCSLVVPVAAFSLSLSLSLFSPLLLLSQMRHRRSRVCVKCSSVNCPHRSSSFRRNLRRNLAQASEFCMFGIYDRRSTLKSSNKGIYINQKFTSNSIATIVYSFKFLFRFFSEDAPDHSIGGISR